MKVSKKAAEKYLNAYKALLDASREITDELDDKNDLIHTKEFGEFKVGDIYFSEYEKKNYPSNPNKWYWYISDIGFKRVNSSFRRVLYDTIIQFSRLDPSFRRFGTSRSICDLDLGEFKKINYVKGKCNFFGLETGSLISSYKEDVRYWVEDSLVIEGFLIDSSLVLANGIMGSDRYENTGCNRKVLLYPNEIKI